MSYTDIELQVGARTSVLTPAVARSTIAVVVTTTGLAAAATVVGITTAATSEAS